MILAQAPYLGESKQAEFGRSSDRPYCGAKGERRLQGAAVPKSAHFRP